MATINKTYHRYKHEKRVTWGRGGKDDIKFYKSRFWRGQRLQQLTKEPLCRECKKVERFTTATVADHIIPRHDGGSDDLDNLQSLCRTCHNRKTAHESSS